MPAQKIEPTLKVLVAEDNLSNQVLMKMYVKSFGGIPVITENGQQAVQEFMKDDFDMILMDLSMPVMDGYSASEKIRAINKDIPIIAVTVFGEAESDRERKKAGINCWLEKPYDRNDLYQAMANCLPGA